MNFLRVLRLVRCWPPLFLASLAVLLTLPSAHAAEFNYAEALQKSLYFYEAQQSGRLSPLNRVTWRGPACLTDGADMGHDLSGGWFDAGDHWTANLTMSFAAMTLAWSAVEHPETWEKTGQMEELLAGLIHVNDYFLRCVLNPECADPATDLDVVIGCGGREGVDEPRVHSMWAPAEVAHLLTRRPTFRVNRTVPAGDIPGAMAAAMAASSMVIRAHGARLEGTPGFESFKAHELADRLLDLAEKLTRFARANAGPVLVEGLPQEDQDRIRRTRSLALRSDGQVVVTGYRADPFDKIVAAASWIQRARRARDPQSGDEWFRFALEVYLKEYQAESNHDWWKDFGAGNFGKLAAFNLMRLAPADERFHAELQLYCTRFLEYRQTPGGLRLREWFAHEYGSLRHANNAAAIVLYYSDHVLQAPTISGNTWWKKGRSNVELQAEYRAAGRTPVDYALGANPYRRSYLVGFGKEPFNHPHHRGAYGAWAGFDHFIPGKADDRGTNRHVLYGALLAGPDHNDVFLCGERLKWLPVPGTSDHDFYYQFPNRTNVVRKEGYQWQAEDRPEQVVMDSKFNEVALDYNAGFTANLVWLLAHGQGSGGVLPVFPPPETRREDSDPLRTDREFFVTARRSSDSPAELELTLWNRSRWPARIRNQLGVRMPVPSPPAANLDITSVRLTGDPAAKLSWLKDATGRVVALELRFPDAAIYPGTTATASRTVRLSGSEAGWMRSLPWADGLTNTWVVMPEVDVFDDSVPRL
ncbi:MAG: glycoside hydrolase family 9 protein [Verrucomicrobia bacterium]|nr:glycoside hydrolase family 9 protein [Verrucomicrobiota bacterium]